MTAQTFLSTHCTLPRNPNNLHGTSRNHHHHLQHQSRIRPWYLLRAILGLPFPRMRAMYDTLCYSDAL